MDGGGREQEQAAALPPTGAVGRSRRVPLATQGRSGFQTNAGRQLRLTPRAATQPRRAQSTTKVAARMIAGLQGLGEGRRGLRERAAEPTAGAVAVLHWLRPHL